VTRLTRLIPSQEELIVSLSIDQWEKDLIGAVASLVAVGPANLLKRVNVDRDHAEVTESDLVDLLEDDNQQSSEGVRRLALALSHWDFEQAPPWDIGEDATDPRSVERRAKVYGLLRLPPEAAQRLHDIAPVATMRTTVISTKWTPWYTPERRIAREFYWPHYKDHLSSRPGFSAEAVEALDLATDDVVQRLSDPTADHLYQSKGLVVGYVQSGKTANFTGVIAKAIDAGYRLIIVMTGTIEMLRSQTQRRLDMELVGRENLVRGIVDTSKEFDYVDDVAWLEDKFIRHGEDFLARGYPAIERLTFLNDDYQRLRQGLTRLQLQFRDRARPFNDPENLYPADVQLVVVKKHKTVLENLARDLEPLRDKLSEVPALIIDDEADLASVNTKNPRRTAERTAINKAIRKLLGYLERGQLVMYTATPFANFFVDPDDAEDIFPKNFIVTLDRPPNYMGVEDFHDIDWNTEDDKGDPAKSNERAFVRAVGPPPAVDDADDFDRRVKEMQTALDSFLLAGAVKVFREHRDGRRFRHHTMMVHEDMRNAAQREQAELVREAWKRNAYETVKGTARLRTLWNDDMHPVCVARAGEEAVPDNFDLLKKPIGEAYRRITEVGDPVLIINGDTDVQANQQTLDFDRNDVWRILVGGAKLSRGFTVEGLTTSFYTRKALQGDTLMQAGRWFGFRDRYRDLVRLFIRRDRKDQPNRVDLYEAFEGLMRDERALRLRLQEYEGFQADGTPILEPWQVPPVVTQHLPYLRPAARDKMFNAEIHTMGDSGRLRDYYGLPRRHAVDEKRANFELFVPVLNTLTGPRHFMSSRPKPEETPRPFEALTGVMAADGFIAMLRKMKWHPDYLKVAEPLVRFWDGLLTKGVLDDVVIVWPRLTKSVETRCLPGLGDRQVVTRKRRADPRVDFVGSDSKHRDALERIAGTKKDAADPEADDLRDPSGRRGSILLYVAADRADAGDGESPASSLAKRPAADDLVVLMSMVAPATATPQGRPVVEWTVKRRSESGSVVVNSK
jgi:hypothetical protein